MLDIRFEKLVQELLDNEGGYTLDPDDPGGETKYGISKRSYPYLDIKNLTIEEAKEIYYKDWWIKHNYYKICDDELAGEVLDLAPNMGAMQANKLLQRAVYKTGGVYLVVDGVIGPKSINAINTHPNMWWLTDRFRLEAIKFYLDLNRSKYLASWVRRSLI